MSVSNESSHFKTAILVGLGIAASAFGARMAIRTFQRIKGGSGSGFTAFYKGGFEDRMTKKEAALILGVRYFVYLLLESPLVKIKSKKLIEE